MIRTSHNVPRARRLLDSTYAANMRQLPAVTMSTVFDIRIIQDRCFHTRAERRTGACSSLVCAYALSDVEVRMSVSIRVKPVLV